MKTRKTSFRVTETALNFENLILSHMDIPRTTFHRRMIDYFIEHNVRVHEYLLITNRNDPNYVKKTTCEQIYLDEGRDKKLEAIAKKYNCTIGVLLFQAMMTYCIETAKDVLGPEELAKYFGMEAS